MTRGLPPCGPRSARFLSRYPRPIPVFPSLQGLTTAYLTMLSTAQTYLRLVIGWSLKNEMQADAVEPNLWQEPGVPPNILKDRQPAAPGPNTGPYVGLPIWSGAETRDREVQCCHTNSKSREGVIVRACYVFSMLMYQIQAIRQGGRVLYSVLWGYENKPRLFPYTALSDWFV